MSACVYTQDKQDREAMIESLNYNATLDYFSIENNKVTSSSTVGQLLRRLLTEK